MHACFNFHCHDDFDDDDCDDGDFDDDDCDDGDFDDNDVEQERPPPVPPSRPYTVTGNRKIAYPQSRVMKNSFPGKRLTIITRVLS